MAVRLTKPWLPRSEALAQLRGHLGVFELADAEQNVVYIGFAGGKSPYGMKGEVAAALERFAKAQYVRVEINTAYRTRHRELLMAYIADHDRWPEFNEAFKLGRLSPA